MKIGTIGYEYKNYNNCSIKKTEPIFCGRRKFKHLTSKDVFCRTVKQLSLKNITEIKKGEYGTVCKGSIPLKPFFSLFKSHKMREYIIKKGLSTNTQGYAFALLKSEADVPLSTSFVHSCSVMYLYNENSNTHFLYHIFDEINEDELKEIIKNYMPEGFTSAAIVPGDKNFVYDHKEYLPDVFNAIRNSNQDARIQVFHDSSEKPEIVGYQGKVFEIKNAFYSKPLTERYYMADQGQATFRIQDIRIYDIEDEIALNSLEELINLKSEIYKRYNKYIAPIVEKLIDIRIEHITKIKSFKTLSDVENYIKSQNLEQSVYSSGISAYYNVMNNQSKNIFRI